MNLNSILTILSVKSSTSRSTIISINFSTNSTQIQTFATTKTFSNKITTLDSVSKFNFNSLTRSTAISTQFPSQSIVSLNGPIESELTIASISPSMIESRISSSPLHFNFCYEFYIFKLKVACNHTITSQSYIFIVHRKIHTIEKGD
jgi:hypothetical protein